jgi:hypothetical protein
VIRSLYSSQKLDTAIPNVLFLQALNAFEQALQSLSSQVAQSDLPAMSPELRGNVDLLAILLLKKFPNYRKRFIHFSGFCQSLADMNGSITYVSPTNITNFTIALTSSSLRTTDFPTFTAHKTRFSLP